MLQLDVVSLAVFVLPLQLSMLLLQAIALLSSFLQLLRENILLDYAFLVETLQCLELGHVGLQDPTHVLLLASLSALLDHLLLQVILPLLQLFDVKLELFDLYLDRLLILFVLLLQLLPPLLVVSSSLHLDLPLSIIFNQYLRLLDQ